MRKLLLLFIVMWSVPALGFNQDGFYSGMTREQALVLLHARGLHGEEILPGSIGISSNTPPTKVNGGYGGLGGLAFCHDALNAYTLPELDVDRDLIPAVEDMIARYGQPVVKIVPTPIVARGGGGSGSVRQLRFEWLSGDDLITINFEPKSETTTKAAFLRYFSRSPCSTHWPP